jgi:hypothetical protein
MEKLEEQKRAVTERKARLQGLAPVLHKLKREVTATTSFSSTSHNHRVNGGTGELCWGAGLDSSLPTAIPWVIFSLSDDQAELRPLWRQVAELNREKNAIKGASHMGSTDLCMRH